MLTFMAALELLPTEEELADTMAALELLPTIEELPDAEGAASSVAFLLAKLSVGSRSRRHCDAFLQASVRSKSQHK